MVSVDYIIGKGRHEAIKQILRKNLKWEDRRYKIRIVDSYAYKFKNCCVTTESLLLVIEEKHGEKMLKKDGRPYKRVIGKEFELIIREATPPEYTPLLVVFDDIIYAIAPIIPDKEPDNPVIAEPIGEAIPFEEEEDYG